MPRRTDDELIAEMLEAYPADPLKIHRCVTGIRILDKRGGTALAEFGPPGLALRRRAGDLLGPLFDKEERKRRTQQLQKYRARLLAVKRYRPHWWGLRALTLDKEAHGVRKAFLTALDEEIKRVNETIGPGKKRRDMVAAAAVAYAKFLLPPEQCTLTNGGPYHRYCMLLYEANTGDHDSGKLLRYMKVLK
jgi:hypothetical protein